MIWQCYFQFHFCFFHQQFLVFEFRLAHYHCWNRILDGLHHFWAISMNHHDSFPAQASYHVDADVDLDDHLEYLHHDFENIHLVVILSHRYAIYRIHPMMDLIKINYISSMKPVTYRCNGHLLDILNRNDHF